MWWQFLFWRFTVHPQCSIATCFTTTIHLIHQAITPCGCSCDKIWQLCVFFVPQVELKFPAPSKTGNYQYSVILRSDSYLGLDQIKPLKVTRKLCVLVYIYAHVSDCLENACHWPKRFAELRQSTHRPRPKCISSSLNNGVNCCRGVGNKGVRYEPNRAWIALLDVKLECT